MSSIPIDDTCIGGEVSASALAAASVGLRLPLLSLCGAAASALLPGRVSEVSGTFCAGGGGARNLLLLPDACISMLELVEATEDMTVTSSLPPKAVSGIDGAAVPACWDGAEPAEEGATERLSRYSSSCIAAAAVAAA